MKKKKGETEEESLAKLVKLTKLMKTEKVKVSAKGLPKFTNKWRSSEPKFAPKPQKSSDVVQAGGMDVDPSLKEAYENWRKDKIEEENYRREQSKRKAEAARKARLPPADF